MCCDCVVQVLIKYNMSSSVAPASYVNSYTDCRRMTCCVLNINAHYRIFSAHTLWSKADCIDSYVQKVQELLFSKNLQEKLKRQGLDFVCSERTWVKSVKEYEKVYASAMAFAD